MSSVVVVKNSRPAHVWVILQTSGFGGTEVHTIHLVKALCDSGHNVYLVCIDNSVLDGKIVHPRLRIVHVAGNLMSDIPADWRELEKLFRERKNECMTLVLQKGNVGIGTAPFLKMCRRYFRYIYLVQHSMPPRMAAIRFTKVFGLIPAPSLWWLNEWLSRRAPSRYADKVIAVSNAVARALTEDYGYPVAKVIKVSNGVFLEDFSESLIAREVRINGKLAAGVQQVVFGMLTRLDKIKGIDIALKAFQLLQFRRPDIIATLLIFGNGEEASNLKALADQLGVGHQVTFEGYTADSARACALFDVIVLSSRSEGLPLALLEGMAAGCIPIVTNVGGMPEVVDDPRIGFVVEPNAESLCLGMCSVLDMSSRERQAMREAAVTRVRKEFDANKSFSRLARIITGGSVRTV